MHASLLVLLVLCVVVVRLDRIHTDALVRRHFDFVYDMEDYIRTKYRSERLFDNSWSDSTNLPAWQRRIDLERRRAWDLKRSV